MSSATPNTMNRLPTYLLARLSEPSTWRGIIALLTAAGLTLDPDEAVAIVTAGVAVIGVIGAFLPDDLQ